MSNLINKVKDALHGDSQHTSTTHTTGTTGHTTGTAEGVHGPHSSRVANAADPRVDSDMDGSRHVGGATTGTTGYSTGTTGTAEGVHGPHNSRVANAMDPRVDSDRDGSSRVGGTTTTGTHHATTGVTGGNTYAHGTSGTAEGVAGPHNSRVANAMDPRVDSDRDGSSRVGGTTTTGTHHATTGVTGGNTYAHGTSGTAEGVAGPHNSRVANAMDPRVDSDRDGSSRVGGTTTTGGSNIMGSGYNNSANTTTGTTGTTTGTTGTTGGLGPHSSSLLNKLDPRVDSTTGQVKSTTGTTGTTSTTGTHTHSTTTGNNHTGTTGGLSHSTNAGPHDSNMANKLDPRVDSDLDGRGNRHGAATGGVFGASGSHATAGSGTAQNTAGPHNSDMMNKIDPRVDSDRDGSATMGGNRTHAGTTHKDPHDAAQVPPSVLREHIGEPKIMHDDHAHDHQGRHGSLTHQETHRGI